MTDVNVARLKTWMFDQALPLWAELGTDRIYGGCVEQLALDASPSEAGFKRVRVTARQIYVYSHAYLMGWEPGLDIARTLYKSFVESAWLGDGIGWAKLLTPQNGVMDDTIDLYDNAFALFAMGWFYRASGETDALRLAHATAAIIDTKLRHPVIGFWHQVPPHGPRLQNPHMHLLEACLACLDAFQDPLIERLAREVIDIFQTKFFSLQTQTLCEYFDDNLAPVADDMSKIVEPGHQMEWAWILSKASQTLCIEARDTIEGLVRSGEEFGVARTGPLKGLTYNSVTTDGQILDGGSRTWPNTERLKAAVALFETFGTDPRPVLNETLDALFEKHLKHNQMGLWIDAFDQNGFPIAKSIPTSTFYHIYLAFAEIVRIEPALKAESSRF